MYSDADEFSQIEPDIAARELFLLIPKPSSRSAMIQTLFIAVDCRCSMLMTREACDWDWDWQGSMCVIDVSSSIETTVKCSWRYEFQAKGQR